MGSFVYRTNDSSALKLYLKDIGDVPLLTPQEEVKLARRIKKGDERALNKLVESNLRFVVRIAKEYTGLGLPLDDMINEGNMGLIKAARKFDPDKGYKFISYAVWWIRQSILQAISDQAKMIRLPANKARALNKLERTFSRLSQQLGRSPTVDEMARELELSSDKVDEIMKVSRDCVSLDTPINDSGDSQLMDLIADENSRSVEQSFKTRIMKEDIQRLLFCLSAQEKEVIELRYGLSSGEPLTLEDVGKHMRLTRERIRQIEHKAITRIRHNMGDSKLKVAC
jgi:RNA polymerase primary sigma factor